MRILNQMGPSSSEAAAVGVIQLCGEVLNHCHVVLRGAKSVETELASLIEELTNRQGLMTTVRDICGSSGPEFDLSLRGKERVEPVHERMHSAIKYYEDLVQKLRGIVVSISGADPKSSSTSEPALQSQIDMGSKRKLDRIAKA